MKKILFPLALLFCLVPTRAQVVNVFPTEHDKFMNALSQFMTASKMQENIKLMDDMQKRVKENKLSAGWLDQTIATCNMMLERSMNPNPHFYNYLSTVLSAAANGKSDPEFTEWNNLAQEVLQNQKKGDNHQFEKFVDFSKSFFEHNALNETSSKIWKVDATSYKFSNDDNKPAITFPACNLTGSTKGDSISVKQSSGVYYPLETKWIGKQGRVDWSRAGLDPAKIYCTFKDDTINLSGFGYTVDTVLFVDGEYFKAPLHGKLQDKISSTADSNHISYPRFTSYELGMTIKDLAPNVSYTGGFSLNGSKVLGYGTADEKATLTFYARDGKTRVLSCKAQNLSIKKGEELGADKAEVSIYFGTDSIYHPQLTLVYKIQKREMRLLRGETGLGQAKFTDSYHNDDFQTDAIFWNLDSSILNLRILSGVGKKPGIYESTNYFNKKLITQIQGLASYEPLSVLKRLSEKTNSRDINALDFARALDPNLKEGEVKSLLYDLVANGFVLYNEDQGVITVKDKTINYVLAKAKKIDYDIINIKSAPQSGNDYIDLKSSDIDLKGVYKVPVSDTAFVYFYPKNSSINLQKDRNMQFDGTMVAGRMDMMGEKFKFQYLPFTVDLTKVDTMRINIPDSGKVDADGNPILRPMKSKVEGIKGLLEIDAPINKSGRTRLPQFPRLYSRDTSYIYYDDSSTAKGAYNRKSFFFALEPFRLDSLNCFSPNIINWPGKLVSGGIFPDIKDSVHLQDDESLGFKGETPEDGIDLYKGKGKYYGKYELNYSGLQGAGKITHSTSAFNADNIRLYPDSLQATADSFSIAKTFEGVKTPKVAGDSDLIFWRPNADSMDIRMITPNKPFAMYDDSFTNFKGNLLLTGKGLNGNGTLDWDLATLTARDFTFHTMDLSADTASLNIKTTGDKVSFKTPNVSAKVDFKTRIGDFKSNLPNIPTDFSYNQYNTAINEFKWFMDEKILDFKATPNGPGAWFNSTRPDQKGLRFIGYRATYNLETSVLRIEKVTDIRVADASVAPDSGVVVIEGEAKMHQLRNAVITADTIKKFFRFDSCIVDIFSKEDLKGTGDYHYETKGIKETISFGDISTKKDTEGKRKKEHDIFRLVAKAAIDSNQHFMLYPNVSFNGEADVLSTDSLMSFKGFAKIGLKNPLAPIPAFAVDQGANPKVMALKYDTTAKGPGDMKVSAGMHINPVPDKAQMYTTLLSPKKNYADISVFKTSGIISQSGTGEWIFGDEKKIKENALTGNIIKYDDKKGTVKAEGSFSLGFNFGMIKYAAAGTADAQLDSGKYKLNLSFAINPQINDKMQERLEFYMAGDNASAQDITYESDKQRKAFHELLSNKDDKKFLDDFDKTTTLNARPKNFDYNLVFTDVNFVWDPDDISLRSTGKIGVALVGKKVISKKLTGYIEMQYKGGVDVFTIYIETGTKGWFYFEYKPGTFGVLSSYEDFNNQLIAVAPDKRKINGDNKKFYLYTPASPLDKSDFVDYMADKAKGISRPHPEMHTEAPPMPAFTDTSTLNNLPGDTGGMPSPKPDANQQEINSIQQMQMQGGGILSGPPPDRLKKDTVPASPQPKEQNKQQEELNEINQMKGEGQNILSGPPPERLKQPAAKDTTPAIPPAAPPVKLDTTPVAPPPAPAPPKEEIKQDAPPPTPPVKQDTTPVAPPPAPPKDANSQSPPNQTASPQVPVTPPSAPANGTPTDTTMPKPAAAPTDSVPH